MSTTLGTPREREWACLCTDGAAIRAASLARCPRCGTERPDTAAIDHAIDEARRTLDALETFDRLSDKVGRLQAMSEVLRRYGRRA